MLFVCQKIFVMIWQNSQCKGKSIFFHSSMLTKSNFAKIQIQNGNASQELANEILDFWELV